MGKRKQRRFVPVEQAMQIKLSQRAREMLALLWIGLSLYVLLSLATFQDASVLVGGDSIPRGGFRRLGGSLRYTLAAGLLCWGAVVPRTRRAVGVDAAGGVVARSAIDKAVEFYLVAWI